MCYEMLPEYVNVHAITVDTVSGTLSAQMPTRFCMGKMVVWVENAVRCRGDLIVLMGNVAIETSGGPRLGFCGGRIDDPNGSASLPLGPSSVQQSLGECGLQADPNDSKEDCPKPFGPVQVPVFNRQLCS